MNVSEVAQTSLLILLFRSPGKYTNLFHRSILKELCDSSYYIVHYYEGLRFHPAMRISLREGR